MQWLTAAAGRRMHGGARRFTASLPVPLTQDRARRGAARQIGAMIMRENAEAGAHALPDAVQDSAIPLSVWRIALVEGMRTLEETQLELLQTLAEAHALTVGAAAADAVHGVRIALEDGVHGIECAFAREGLHVRRRLHRDGTFGTSVLSLMAHGARCAGRDAVLTTMLAGALSRLLMHAEELLAIAEACDAHEIAHVLRMAIAGQRRAGCQLRDLAQTGSLAPTARTIS
jgi:hypothetical protein